MFLFPVVPIIAVLAFIVWEIAAVLAAVGLPGDFFPVAFAISRSVGWSAHVLEQVEHNRLIRPASEYVGPEPTKTFVPIDER